MAPLGKNKRNESIKYTPDRYVPQQCLQAVPCLKHIKQQLKKTSRSHLTRGYVQVNYHISQYLSFDTAFII